MRCRGARSAYLERPLDQPVSAIPGLASHLEECAECRSFAARADLARQALGEHHLEVEPGPAFATRVTARLPAAGSRFEGVALRLLPATLALALALLGWCVATTPSPGELVQQVAAADGDEDLVTWIVDGGDLSP